MKNKVEEVLKDILDIIWGSEEEEPKQPTVKMGKIPYEGMWEGKPINFDWPKRARTKKGTYKGDDKSTKDVNEAWVGGKAPKKTRKKK